MINDDMREIFNEFIVEAEENLDKLEQDLLELENDPENEDILNSAFRAMHTLKGGAGFLGLDAIVEVAHAAEDILGKLREGAIRFSSDINDAILSAIDFIRNAIKRYDEGEEVEPPRELVEKLRSLASGAAPSSSQGEEDKGLNRLLEKYGFSHLKGKPVEEVLEELILLPPDERPDELIAELDKLISAGGSPQEPEEEYKEKELEADMKMIEMAHQGGEEKGSQEGGADEEPPPEQEKKQEKKEVKKVEKKEKSGGEKVLRIDVDKIEALMNLVGELVLERNRLVRGFQKISQECISKDMDEFETILSSIDRIVGDLQLAVMKTRMQPVKRLFQKFPRVVRDLSKMLGKEVELLMEGEDVEMDKTIIEKLEEPMIHLIRNAIDHGIESAEERERLGKPRKGTVLLKAYYQGDRIFVEIADDGRGIDIDKVKLKALEKGIVSKERLDKMSKKEILFLIFHPGFSTKEDVSEVSGRGVGMDVVITTVSNFRGTIDIETEKNKGTRIIMSFPLTIGIIRSLLVSIKDRYYAIPIYSVLEIIQGEDAEIKTLSGKEVLLLREQTIPLFRLGGILGVEESHIGYIIVAQVGGQRAAFTVEELYGDEEIVIKPFGKIVGDIQGISGATITGEGKVVLILDLEGILKREVNSATII